MDLRKIPNISNNEWVYPEKKNYKFICCDCGLVHSIDFESILLIPTGKTSRTGGQLCQPWGTPKAFNVRFRARVDTRMTTKIRKLRKEKDGRLL
jgi:hypothetical protein